MRLLFINAIDVDSEVEKRYPSLGLGYLAVACRASFGHEDFQCKIIDAHVESELDRYKPDIVCISSVTHNYPRAAKYAAFAKSRRIPVIVGGIHISMVPESLTADMDVACIGEAEETIVALLRLYTDRGRFQADGLQVIPGIAFRRGSELVRTAVRPLIASLDSIAYPARDLLDIHAHTYMFTSRGCPYDCIFCASTAFWQKPRFASAEYVVAEIHELVSRYRVKIISFFDDLFIGNIVRLRAIVELLEKSSLLSAVSFTCSARANLINEEVCQLLSRMNVRSVGMGLESGSATTLRYLKGGNITVEDNQRAVRLLRKYRISPNASFVIGAPQETHEDIAKTYFFIRNNPVGLFDTYVLTPFPGTEIWTYACKKGLVSSTMDWTRLNVDFGLNAVRAVIVSEVLSRKELQRWVRKFAWLRLYKNILNVWTSPQVFDLPQYIVGYIRQKVSRWIKKH